jgi:hypothetical protein
MKSIQIRAIVVLAACGFAPPETAPPDSRIANEAFEFVTKLLGDEARQAKIDKHFPRSTANFAEGSEGHIDLALFSQKILAPLDKDPVIDAYIRWQLTSYKPSLDSVPLNDRRFARMLDDLPPLLANPKADASLLEAFRKAQQTESLTPEQIKTLNAHLNELATRESDANALNVAALGFRDWVGTQLPTTGERRLLWRIEQLEARLSAGWPCDEAKQSLETHLQKSRKSTSFDDRARQRVADALAALEGRQATYIASASIRENQLYVEYGLVGAFDFDVRRWSNMLRRE